MKVITMLPLNLKEEEAKLLESEEKTEAPSTI